LLQSAEQVNALHDLLGGQVDFMRVFEKLTQLLPDDTYILALKYQGGKFNITGQTANSSTVMQALGGQSGFKDVRAPSPATRGRRQQQGNLHHRVRSRPRAVRHGSRAADTTPPATAAAPHRPLRLRLPRPRRPRRPLRPPHRPAPASRPRPVARPARRHLRPPPAAQGACAAAAAPPGKGHPSAARPLSRHPHPRPPRRHEEPQTP
jgi:general secretion pathway protein L